MMKTNEYSINLLIFPFGLVAAEAICNGIAIIASKVGGIPEIVKKNGILIEFINKSKLYDELERLILDSNKRKFFQKASWDNFTFHAKNSSQKLDSFREKILDESKLVDNQVSKTLTKLMLYEINLISSHD